MKQTIFVPCDMKETAFRYWGDPLEDDRFCPQYVFKPESGAIIRKTFQGGTIDRYTLRVPYVLGTAHESGGAGLTSTLEDYCRFQEGMISGKILKLVILTFACIECFTIGLSMILNVWNALVKDFLIWHKILHKPK